MSNKGRVAQFIHLKRIEYNYNDIALMLHYETE